MLHDLTDLFTRDGLTEFESESSFLPVISRDVHLEEQAQIRLF